MDIMKPSLRHIAHDVSLMSIGIIMYAIGFTLFQLPYHITPGATTGLAAIVFYITGLPVTVTYFVINIVLLVVALKILGFKFMANTIYGIVFMTFVLWAIPAWFGDENGMLPQILGEHDMFMACIIGAIIEGIGLGFVFNGNGSTGGTDIVGAVVNHYRDISIGQGIMIADLLIISSSFLVFHDVRLLIYGYCTLFIETSMIDYVMNRGRQSVQFFIFSDKYDEIAAEIAKTGRGVTVLDSQGWYTKQQHKVLVVLARRRESPFIFRVIKTLDPNAFVSQSKVVGVFGNGFDRIKGK
ncbi:MAG: YitT family protein [Bacteroidaceae bacterium]|nr:YitT family protein [Bacteroidaceae bacterium]